MKRFSAMCICVCIFMAMAGCKESEDGDSASAPKKSATRITEKIRLNDHGELVVNELVVVQRRNGMVDVELLYNDTLIKKYTLGNVLYNSVSVREVDIDNSNRHKEYLITMPNKSSTYGAETGLIVHWLGWWRFLVIPDDRFIVKDLDNDGISEIHCERLQQKVYAMEKGILIGKRISDKDGQTKRTN